MKNKSFILDLILFVAAISFYSCATFDNLNSSKTYKDVIVSEDTDYLTTKIQYPEFSDNKLLNRYIKNSILSNWDQFKFSAENEWTEINNLNYKTSSKQSSLSPFEYTVKSDVYESAKYTSVLVKTYVYEGGAHGNTFLNSYTFDKSSNKIVNAAKVSGLSYSEISNECKKQLTETLIKKNKNENYISEVSSLIESINEGTTPSPGNFEIFTTDGKYTTIYFEPYSVAPYSYGILSVKLKNN